MKETFTLKEMENAVMLAADLYQRMYDSPMGGDAFSIAHEVIDEAVKMEGWLVNKYGEDDDAYLDRLEEYEEMVEEKHELPKRTVWVVSYVGLSDNEPKANGYSESHVYSYKEQAVAKMKALLNNEVEHILSMGETPCFEEIEPTSCRITWSGGNEQLRLTVSEVELDA